MSRINTLIENLTAGNTEELSYIYVPSSDLVFITGVTVVEDGYVISMRLSGEYDEWKVKVTTENMDYILVKRG